MNHDDTSIENTGSGMKKSETLRPSEMELQNYNGVSSVNVLSTKEKDAVSIEQTNSYGHVMQKTKATNNEGIPKTNDIEANGDRNFTFKTVSNDCTRPSRLHFAERVGRKLSITKTDELRIGNVKIPYQNPFVIFSCSLLIALVFVLIPNENYWIYSLIRLEWWAFICVYAFIEIQAIALPDVTDVTYISAFLFGFVAAPATHVLAFLVNLEDNYYLNTLAVAYSLVFIIAIFGYDGFSKGEQRDSISGGSSSITATSESTGSISFVANIMHHSIAAHTGMSIAFYGTGEEDKTKVIAEIEDEDELTNELKQNVANETQTSNRRHKQRNKGELYDTLAAVLDIDETIGQQGSPLESNSENSPLRNAWHTLTYQRLKSHNRQNNAHYLRKGNWIMNALQRAEDDEIDGTSLEVPWSCIKRLGLHIAVHIFPRYYYQKWNIENGIIIGDRRYLWFYSSLFNALWIVYYTFLQYFTLVFQSYATAGVYYQTGLFIFYVIVGSGVRVVMKRLSLSIDRMKRQSVSMYFVGEVLCLYFYYTFYRVLFESITSWAIFSIIQVLHLGAEWILYPLRASKYFYDFIDGLDEDRGCNRILRSLINTKGLNHKDWISFIALDFGIRCCILFASAFGISFILIIIEICPWIENGLKQDQSQLNTTITFIVVSVTLEALNASAMHRLFFQGHNINIRLLTCHCFKNVRFCFLSCLLAAILFINPVYAFTTGNIFRR